MPSTRADPRAPTPGAMFAARSGARSTGRRSSVSAGTTASPGFDSRSGSSPADCVTLMVWGMAASSKGTSSVEVSDVTEIVWTCRSNPSNSKATRYSPAEGTFNTYLPLLPERAVTLRPEAADGAAGTWFAAAAVTTASATASPAGSVMRPQIVPGCFARAAAVKQTISAQVGTNPALEALAIAIRSGSDPCQTADTGGLELSGQSPPRG